jgi:GMP synthase (glutamine-hydrolysing)
VAHQLVLILDFGSQTTQLIARRVREKGVYCEILACTTPAWSQETAAARGLTALILSGGPSSVDDHDAPAFDAGWLALDLPVLGICYGMQLLAALHGGAVDRAERREFGAAEVEVDDTCALFAGLGPREAVWMSHGDHVHRLPAGWRAVAQSPNCPIAAMVDAEGRRFGIQLHPEVEHSQHGAAMLANFLAVAGARGDWTMGSFIEEAVARIRAQVGEGHVMCALSGGVDSAVVAALLRRAIGDRLHCVFVDNGLLRQGERQSVADEFADFDLRVVDASDLFLSGLDGVSEPERKRRIIGEAFIRVFEAEAEALRARVGEIRFLAQGTLYPDVIESVSFRGPSATIKSHHNVGGLPARMNMALVEPLRELFKDEARAVGLLLGLSEARVYRQPFPGPGLAVRIPGAVTPKKVALLQAADAIVDAEIRAAGLYRQLWQSFVVLLPVQSVGVMGDARTYELTASVRAVHSNDGMTAEVAELPWSLLKRISSRIINEVRGINRVLYDISTKPPATIEWE